MTDTYVKLALSSLTILLFLALSFLVGVGGIVNDHWAFRTLLLFTWAAAAIATSGTIRDIWREQA